MSASGVVVADTTPLNYLVLIRQAEVLHQLFGEVIPGFLVLATGINHRVYS